MNLLNSFNLLAPDFSSTAAANNFIPASCSLTDQPSSCTPYVLSGIQRFQRLHHRLPIIIIPSSPRTPLLSAMPLDTTCPVVGIFTV
ncbi:hypothetical protein [Acetobacterium woodii]|uniref:hypothetical protein n=1 Tax=Acetobacterium woodii TaxID=33952 RepID=UPI0011AE6F88|nr:hypothetical protein [Acetobacterium woodii]